MVAISFHMRSFCELNRNMPFGCSLVYNMQGEMIEIQQIHTNNNFITSQSAVCSHKNPGPGSENQSKHRRRPGNTQP